MGLTCGGCQAPPDSLSDQLTQQDEVRTSTGLRVWCRGGGMCWPLAPKRARDVVRAIAAVGGQALLLQRVRQCSNSFSFLASVSEQAPDELSETPDAPIDFSTPDKQELWHKRVTHVMDYLPEVGCCHCRPSCGRSNAIPSMPTMGTMGCCHGFGTFQPPRKFIAKWSNQIHEIIPMKAQALAVETSGILTGIITVSRDAVTPDQAAPLAWAVLQAGIDMAAASPMEALGIRWLLAEAYQIKAPAGLGSALGQLRQRLTNWDAAQKYGAVDAKSHYDVALFQKAHEATPALLADLDLK